MTEEHLLGDLALTAPEQRLVDAFRRGVQVDLREGDAAKDDPRRGKEWGPRRTVRAEVIERLVLGTGVAPEAGRVPALRLRGARITGRLDLAHGTIGCPVWLEDCSFAEPVVCDRADVRHLSLAGSRLPALRADYLRSATDLDLTRITARELRLYGAEVNGNLELDDARLVNVGGCALYGTHLKVNGSLHANGASIEGEARLYGAAVQDSVLMIGTWLLNPGGTALAAGRMSVGGSLYMRRGDHGGPVRRAFVADGKIRLDGVTIGSTLRMEGAVMHNPGQCALEATNLNVGHFADLRGVTVRGWLTLSESRIGSSLDLTGGRVISDAQVSLDLSEIEAKTVSLPESCSGTIDLTDTRVVTLDLHGVATTGTMRLGGLHFERLTPELPPKQLLAWLRRSVPAYEPHPYEQLVAMFRRIGHDEDARTVLLAKERRRRETLRLPGRLWGYVQDVMMGYGYRPLRAGAWLLLPLALATWYYSIRPPRPLDADNGLAFSPLAYALDLLLPVVDLGQEKAFGPATPVDQWFGYAVVAIGWILATVIAAGISRVLKRQ